MGDQKQRYLVLEQGSDLFQYFTIRSKQTGLVLDLEALGYTDARLQVRTATLSDGGELLMDLDVGNGGVSIEYIADVGDGTARTGYIYSGAEAMSSQHLPPFQDAVYEFVAIHGGVTRKVISRGPAMLIPQVVDNE